MRRGVVRNSTPESATIFEGYVELLVDGVPQDNASQLMLGCILWVGGHMGGKVMWVGGLCGWEVMWVGGEVM